MSSAADITKIALATVLGTGVFVTAALALFLRFDADGDGRRRAPRRRLMYSEDDSFSDDEETDLRRRPRRRRPVKQSSQVSAISDDREVAKNLKQQITETMSAGWEGFSMEQAMEHADAGHEKAKLRSPSEVLSELQKGNTRFWSGQAKRPEKSAFERRALITKQFPTVAVLGCSDSRVPTEIIFDMGLGDIFVVRVAGNCLNTATLASLQYAVHHLKVKVLVVMGHEGCGAVKAAERSLAEIDKEPECLSSLLRSVRKGLDIERLQNVHDARARDREAVATNVRSQLARLALDAGLTEKVQATELIIIGAFYEISSGIVDFFYEVTVDSENVKPSPSVSDDENADNAVDLPGTTQGVSSRLLVRKCSSPKSPKSPWRGPRAARTTDAFMMSPTRLEHLPGNESPL